MARFLHFQIPSCCREDWQGMTPQSNGRHCRSCNKTVVDFTQMSDYELQQYFKTPSGHVCGRFSYEQLNRDIPLPRKPIPLLKHFFLFTLPAFLLSLKTAAQVPKGKAQIEVAPVSAGTMLTESQVNELTISGLITDGDGNPVVNASVLIKGTKRGTISDEQGQFTLLNVSSTTTLLISSIGFESKEVKAIDFSRSPGIKLITKLDYALMGEVVVVVRGKKKEKKIKEHQPSHEAVAAILPFPNPVVAGEVLKVQCQNMDKGEYIMELYTLLGQRVQTTKLTMEKNTSELSFTVEKLIAGTYVLRLTAKKSGRQWSRQVVVH